MTRLAIAVTVALALAVPAEAQRVSFERTFDVGEAPTLEVSTLRGKIEVSGGASRQIVVRGVVTVRVGIDVPANAVEIAREVATHPPVTSEGGTVRLRPPSQPSEQRAVTLSYNVTVPAGTRVGAVSDSGATSVSGVSGPVSVNTQSAAIELRALGGSVDVKSGSGAVTADDVAGAVTVTTGSSAMNARGLRSDLRVRTSSGAVNATLVGPGGVDVETSSSGIVLNGVKGRVKATTQSGHVTLRGSGGEPWDVHTGSGAIDVEIGHAILTLEAESGSGSVSVTGAEVQGAVSKKRVAGAIGAGGSLMRLVSRSGSIHVAIDHAAGR